MTRNMARLLLDLDITEIEIIETEQQRVEDRRADLVAKVQEDGNHYILHIEIQNDNQGIMPWRMLRYRTDISLAYPGLDVKQYVIYIGRAKLSMASGIEQIDLCYRYRILDMHSMDCENFLLQNTPDALVFAILCDFGRYSSREVVQRILQGLQLLTGDNETAFRDYLLMLEILSSNRDLKQIVQEEETMLSQIKYSDLPSYGLGMKKGLEDGTKKGMEQGMQQGLEQGLEKGLEKGRQQGEADMLQKLLQLKFGAIPDTIKLRLQNANAAELLHWSERLLSSDNLNDIFTEH